MRKVNIILSTFNSSKYLARYFECVLQQSYIDFIVVSLVMNDPTQEELEIVDMYKEKITLICTVVPRESLYASWNRAIRQSDADYLTCWNVDDCRSIESIEKMVRLLESNPDVGWTYNDFVVVKKYGEISGVRICQPEWNKEVGTNAAIGGPFFMWRRDLLPSVGFFDEQFKSGGDFDYTVRLSFASIGRKTPECIDYFTNEGSGLSTDNSQLQEIERTVIQLRYGIYKTLDLFFIGDTVSYEVGKITNNGKVYKICDVVNGYDLIRDDRKKVIPWLFIYCWQNSFKTFAKIILNKCGLM